jgi:hypothetical protein
MKTDLGGTKCDTTKPIPALARTVTGETYQVATEKTSTCNSVWLTVSPSVGTLSPRETDEKE